uniref:Alpha-tubulin N-acetyltransferase n=1 Tax=Bactrocera latifrons TaxID=174628 RepID=A0A0K8VWC5_BACLA
MAKFKFDIKCIFSQPVVQISSNLLPHTFIGDRRMAMDVTSKVSQIIDRLGELSAVAQKLSKPITSAQKLRMSENQTVYLMADINGCDGDVVIGLLKIGTKNLYLFDSSGQTRKIDKARCILDFYIHESRQRMGVGKILFDIMLTEEHWTPVKCSVDRPSEKLIQFLKKYYGLEKIIPQANKFVLYEGFFDEDGDDDANRYVFILHYLCTDVFLGIGTKHFISKTFKYSNLDIELIINLIFPKK